MIGTDINQLAIAKPTDPTLPEWNISFRGTSSDYYSFDYNAFMNTMPTRVFIRYYDFRERGDVDIEISGDGYKTQIFLFNNSHKEFHIYIEQVDGTQESMLDFTKYSNMVSSAFYALSFDFSVIYNDFRYMVSIRNIVLVQDETPRSFAEIYHPIAIESDIYEDSMYPLKTCEYVKDQEIDGVLYNGVYIDDPDTDYAYLFRLNPHISQQYLPGQSVRWADISTNSVRSPS